MKLKSKIHLYSSLLFAVLLIVMNVSIYFLFNYMSLNSEIEQAKIETTAIARGLQDNATMPLSDLLRAYAPIDGMLQIVAQNGVSYPPVTSPSQTELSKKPAVFYAQKKSEIVKYDGQSYVLISMPVIWHNGEVVNIQTTESLQDTIIKLRSLRFVLIGVTLLALIPVIISGRLLGELIMKPIRSMTTTMRDIQQSGQFKQLTLATNSKDELVEMGDTFNRMIELLQSNFAKQESFVSNASHELRTPLTVIESYANLLKRKGLERPDLFLESIEAIHSEAIRMREMTEQLLLLARNKEQWKMKKEKLDAVVLTANTAAAFQNAYHRDVYVEGVPSLAVSSDEKLLKQLLYIFLDNARKYSDESITITLGSSNMNGWIRITDRGVGIPKQELGKVFDRFYRIDQARSRQSGGLGLGLSLAKQIADTLGANIEMDSLEGVGTTVTITLEKI